jgi:polysaccharide chain length determinant protein (PEP-CTERM system associated)
VTPGKSYSPADILAIARRRRWYILAPFVAVSLGTAIVASYLPNRYRSETLILVVPQRVPETYVRSTVTARIEDRLQSISQQILSRSRLERIINDLGLYAEERKLMTMEDVVGRMRGDIQPIEVRGDSFRIAFVGDEPRTVTEVTQRLASLFIEENLRDREVLAEGSYEFLDSQLEDARRRLKEQEQQLEQYRRKFSGQLPSQVESNIQVIQNTQLQIQALNEAVARDRDHRLVIVRQVADLEAAASAAAAAPAPAVTAEAAVSAPLTGSAAQQLEQARLAQRQMQLRFTPEHPDLIRIARVITTLEEKAKEEARLAAEARGQTPDASLDPAEAARRNRLAESRAEVANIDQRLAQREAEIQQLRGVIREYQARVEAVPTRESELIELTRDYETLQNSYASLLAKKEDSKIAANLERRQVGEQFKVLDPARVPERPFSPNRQQLNLLGAIVGLGLGIGLAALLEVTDTSLKTDDDVVNALSLPVLALVPLIVSPRERKAVRRRTAMVIASSVTVVLAAVALLVWKLSF